MSTSRELDDDVVVLVGHPARGSRTSEVAQMVASGLASHSGLPAVVELGAFGAAGVASGMDGVDRAVELVRRADLLVVATPVYKAGYTGLLKLFLERLDANALDGTVAVPVVLSASPAHAALADLQLRMVLEAGCAHLPIPSFVLEEHHFDHLAEYVDAWQRRFGAVVTAVTHAVALQAAGRSEGEGSSRGGGAGVHVSGSEVCGQQPCQDRQAGKHADHRTQAHSGDHQPQVAGVLPAQAGGVVATYTVDGQCHGLLRAHACSS